MHPILKPLYFIYKFFIFVPIFFGSLVLLGLFIITFSLFLGEIRTGYLVKKWNRLSARLIPAEVIVHGKENMHPGKSYVILPNHRSNFDPMMLNHISNSVFKWIMKKEILRIPVFGFICKRMGNIAIDRKDRESAIKSLEDAKKQITGGRCIVFFPEGTRNKNKGLLPFKKGAFHFAIDTGIDILPVTLNNADDILPAGSINLQPGTVHVFIHPSIESSHYSKDTIEDLIEVTREAIVSKLDSKYLD